MQIAADRYSYLSCLGFAALAGSALTWLMQARERLRPSIRNACLLVAVLIVFGWTTATWRQSKVWHDAETLWRWAQQVDPDCVVCSINLGAELVESRSPSPEGAREAETLFRHALALLPDRDFAYHGLGVALASQGRDREAEAAFREYMRRQPSSAVGPIDLGQLYLSQRRYEDAIPFLRQALAMNANFGGLEQVLAQALRGRAEELRREGRASEGDALLAEAVALQAKGPALRPSGDHWPGTFPR